MNDNYTLTPAEANAARNDIAGYRPTWCKPEPEVTFLDVLRAKASNDAQRLSLVSLQLALRGARVDEGGGVAFVPGPVTNVPVDVVTSRLHATWNGKDVEVGRGGVYVVVGVTLEQAKRLGGRAGLPWSVYTSEGRLRLLRDGRDSDLGLFDIESLLAAIGAGLGAENVMLERRPDGFMEVLLLKRWQQAGGILTEVGLRELWTGR